MYYFLSLYEPLASFAAGRSVRKEEEEEEEGERKRVEGRKKKRVTLYEFSACFSFIEVRNGGKEREGEEKG